MTFAYLRYAFLALAVLVAGAAFADSPRHVDELLHKSGIWKQAADLPAQLKAGAAQARAQEKASGKPGMTDADYDRFVAAMARAFSADRFRRVTAREIERNLSAADEATMLKFLSSDLGLRATRAEEEMGAAMGGEGAQQRLETYFTKVPGARVTKLARLMRAFKAGEGAASTMINVASAIAYGAAVAAPNGDERIARQMRKEFEAQRTQVTEAMNRQLTKVAAYVYRDLSDDDLDRYTEFAQTPAATRFTDVTIKAMDIAFQEGGLELGRYLGREATKGTRSS